MCRKKHWKVCRKIDFDVNKKWYKHEPEIVVEMDSWKMLWIVTIQTYHVNEARRPDMVIIGKIKSECKIIGFACSFNSRIEEKEKDKMKGYNDLKRKLKKIWHMLVKVIPVVVGTLMSDIRIETRIMELQKTTILYSTRIFRNFLEV